jgi:TRAP-type mannitol/chloroaromatic compound transport system permease small subunit
MYSAGKLTMVLMVMPVVCAMVFASWDLGTTKRSNGQFNPEGPALEKLYKHQRC